MRISQGARGAVEIRGDEDFADIYVDTESCYRIIDAVANGSINLRIRILENPPEHATSPEKVEGLIFVSCNSALLLTKLTNYIRRKVTRHVSRSLCLTQPLGKFKPMLKWVFLGGLLYATDWVLRYTDPDPFRRFFPIILFVWRVFPARKSLWPLPLHPEHQPTTQEGTIQAQIRRFLRSWRTAPQLPFGI